MQHQQELLAWQQQQEPVSREQYDYALTNFVRMQTFHLWTL